MDDDLIWRKYDKVGKARFERAFSLPGVRDDSGNGDHNHSEGRKKREK
jgi:hypothetical protein